MRVCRFDNQRLGIVEGDVSTVVRDVTAALDVASAGAVSAAEARSAHRDTSRRCWRVRARSR